MKASLGCSTEWTLVQAVIGEVLYLISFFPVFFGWPEVILVPGYILLTTSVNFALCV